MQPSPQYEITVFASFYITLLIAAAIMWYVGHKKTERWLDGWDTLRAFGKALLFVGLGAAAFISACYGIFLIIVSIKGSAV